MPGWRDELVDIVKSKAEREAEEEARKQKRLAEALEVAQQALTKAAEGLRFANEQLQSKKQPAALSEASDDSA